MYLLNTPGLRYRLIFLCGHAVNAMPRIKLCNVGHEQIDTITHRLVIDSYVQATTVLLASDFHYGFS